jgi:glycosyltransferase involved in cell wall biosynthesis
VPQAVMQALCMELNTVATNDGSTADLYQNNNFLLTNTDLTSIYQNTKKMIESLDNDKFLNKNRGFIIENFSKSVLTNKIIKVYSQIL